MAQLTQDNFQFLKNLKTNNNRDWFNEHKDEYLKQHQNTIEFAEALLEKLNKHDNIETPTGKKGEKLEKLVIL